MNSSHSKPFICESSGPAQQIYIKRERREDLRDNFSFLGAIFPFQQDIFHHLRRKSLLQTL